MLWLGKLLIRKFYEMITTKLITFCDLSIMHKIMAKKNIKKAKEIIKNNKYYDT